METNESTILSCVIRKREIRIAVSLEGDVEKIILPTNKTATASQATCRNSAVSFDCTNFLLIRINQFIEDFISALPTSYCPGEIG